MICKIVCLALLFVTCIDARCSIAQQNMLAELSRRYNLLTERFVELDNIYNQVNDRPNNVTVDFINDLADIALSKFQVTMRIPVQQFVYCQSLIRSEIANAVRGHEKYQDYQLMEDKLNFLKRKRDELMNRSMTDFEEVKLRLQNLERDDCTDFNKLKNDAELIRIQLELMTTSIVEPFESITSSWVELKEESKAQVQAVSRNLANIVTALKSHRDIQACLAY